LTLCLLTAAAISACGGGGSGAETPSAAQTADPQPVATSQTAEGNGPLADPLGLESPAPLLQLAEEVPPSTELAAAQVAVPTASTTLSADSLATATLENAASSSDGTSCGADIGGWTTPAPSALQASVPLRSTSQPGSRLYYISSAQGSDTTGDIYFWDGARIVDSKGSATDVNGVAYGSDPMNPSAAVKPFRRWAFVGPRNVATSDIGTKGVPGAPMPTFRAGYPDWWLFKRGETFDLAEDLLSFERQFNPLATKVYGSLAVPGGRSATERQVVGAYGDLCQARPRFVNPMIGFMSRYSSATSPAFKNVAYLSLHFDGHVRVPGGNYAGVTMLGQTTASVNILFEDIWFDASTFSIGSANAAQITLRRSIITDNYATDGSHVQGLYYDGTREGRFRIEESILMRNGFSHGDPKTMSWPPTGTQVWDRFNRNLYVNGKTDFTTSGMFDSVSMMGASGDQFRPGMQLQRNFFYQGYVSMGARGGYPDAEGSTGSILDNVLQRFVGTGTNDNTGQPGWGIQLGGGAFSVEVANNIVTGAQHSSKWWGVQLTPILQDCYAPALYATRANRIHHNILDTGSSNAALSVTDGTYNSCFGLVLPGVRGNEATDNVLLNTKLRESEYLPVAAAVGTTPDTSYQRNQLYADRTAAASQLGWTDPNRTLKSYLLSKGLPVSSADGFPEYFERATQLRRGQWAPDFTSRAINAYIRTGFGMTADPAVSVGQ
jgi:hypothetical protein